MSKYNQKTLEGIEISGIAEKGRCVARHEGRVIFVKDTAPGDIVDIRIIQKKKSFFEAIPLNFKKLSDVRTEPFCTHFGTCGGCTRQHINYEAQLQYKQQTIGDAFRHIGGFEFPEIQPVLPAPETEFYRNKLWYTFTDNRWMTTQEIESGEVLEKRTIGYYIPGRHDKILDVQKCWLQREPSNKIRLALKEFAVKNDLSFYNLGKNEGLLRNLIIRTTETGDIMVILQLGKDEPDNIRKVTDFLKTNFQEITSLYYVINSKKNETFDDLELILLHGQAFITEEMNGLSFRIGPKSFFQTNSKQGAALYEIIKKAAALTGNELVYDLYSGTGTISCFIADQSKKVIGAEYIEPATEDAKVNAQINNITNVDFVTGDLAKILNDEFTEIHGTPDVIITDPPRAGMHPKVVKRLNEIAAPRIIYVSCNPATQARDLAVLNEKYDITEIQPVDMFPHTHHVENVVRLDLRKHN